MLRLRRARPTVAIVSNEFFDPALGRMGGFGWAARTCADCLATHPDLGYRPLFLVGEGELWDSSRDGTNGVPLLRYEKTGSYARAVRRARPALVLTIDYRPNFLPVLGALPELPILVWVRDPRTPEDHAKIASLRLPSGGAPAGVAAIDCTSLAAFVEGARSRGTRVVIAATGRRLAGDKMAGAYGLEAEDTPLLPNPLEVVPDAPKAAEPTIAFLGRLDPIKRPWIVVELARRFPRVRFLLLGQSHFSGEGAWNPGRLPENVQLLGHVDRAEKTGLLASAWLLVNTSIHEGLAISFLEALHCATPIVSCQDPESVASRFGRYVGRWDGDGLDAVDGFTEAIRELFEDDELRTRIGLQGRDWVRATHTRDHFAKAFESLQAG